MVFVFASGIVDTCQRRIVSCVHFNRNFGYELLAPLLKLVGAKPTGGFFCVSLFKGLHLLEWFVKFALEICLVFSRTVRRNYVQVV